MSLERLIDVAGPALSESTPRMPIECAVRAGALETQLLRLYWSRNGFYAFESALHVFPITESSEEMGLGQWNRPSAWRSTFGGMADEPLFFAADVFGGQFCIANGVVQRFDPETGTQTPIAESIDEWADLMLSDTDVQTGWPMAREWQRRNGLLRAGNRLVPKLPFVLGGNYEISNLYDLDAFEAMRFYGNIAIQIRELPEGASVQLRVTD